MGTHKPLCYYVMHDGSVNKDKFVFERPYISMQQHLKLLYVRDKIDSVGVNGVLIDYGAYINGMPHSFLKRIGKYEIDLKSNNMVLSNYNKKTSRPLGVIQVDVFVGIKTRPTLFVVIPTKENHNLLLGQE